MNLYILVEGKTEKNLYPLWLNELMPYLKPVESPYDVDNNNYYLFSSGGIPSILDDIVSAVEEINEINKFDYFMVILDADELTVAERSEEVYDVFRNENLDFNLDRLIVIVQNRCIETWLLGNRRFFPTNIVDDSFRECVNYFNVKLDDPEKMLRDNRIKKTTTIAQYHEYYLQKMFNERNLSYRKGKCDIVGQRYYLEQLIKRIKETNDLSSFKYFIDTIHSLARQPQFFN